MRALAEEPAPPEPPIVAGDREHWSFRPPQRSDPLAVEDAGWCRTPIDRFILARLEADGLRPAPEADRLTLLRRVTFDLTGLPPTPAEIAAFLADDAPQAYERVVDRLLGSRAYGERYAQHWLDLARFAETDGFEHDHVRPNAWRYRDWVIDALAADMPYDEFVRRQLAGDELSPDDPAAAIGTGFLLCGPDMPDINLQEERRHNFLNSMTGTVGTVFLGLQFECASCHDHKYDPLSQYDFYRLRAFFEPMEIFKDQPVASAADRADLKDFEAARAVRWKELEADIARLRQADPDQNAAKLAELEQELAALKKSEGPPLALGRVVRETSADAKPSHLWVRGDFRRQGPEVEPAFLRVVNADEQRVAPPREPAKSTGRRTALAAWLTRPDHPLATRVIVNRLWQFHFGRGLSATSSDFGLMGESPSHPELLDWLATEFPRQGWSMKTMHRMMVTSAVYRTAGSSEKGGNSTKSVKSSNSSYSSDPSNSSNPVDADNRLLSRFPRRRLEGEAIRDAMLAAAGRLSANAGGPGVRPPLPREVVATLLKDQWPVTGSEEDHRRRSIYLFVRRNLRYPLFEAFDKPDTNQSCPRRNETTIAPQALHLLNSEFSLQCARDLAALLERECGDDRAARIDQLWLRTLGRLPSEDERARAIQFDREGPFVDLCLAVFNLNEFVYVD
jgi:hypothetical protein